MYLPSAKSPSYIRAQVNRNAYGKKKHRWSHTSVLNNTITVLTLPSRHIPHDIQIRYVAHIAQYRQTPAKWHNTPLNISTRIYTHENTSNIQPNHPSPRMLRIDRVSLLYEWRHRGANFLRPSSPLAPNPPFPALVRCHRPYTHLPKRVGYCFRLHNGNVLGVWAGARLSPQLHCMMMMPILYVLPSHIRTNRANIYAKRKNTETNWKKWIERRRDVCVFFFRGYGIYDKCNGDTAFEQRRNPRRKEMSFPNYCKWFFVDQISWFWKENVFILWYKLYLNNLII